MNTHARALAYSFCTKFAALFSHECDDKIFVTAIKHFMSVESENLVFRGAAFGRFRRLRFLRLGNRPLASKSNPHYHHQPFEFFRTTRPWMQTELCRRGL
jgi:hypothetical protein